MDWRTVFAFPNPVNEYAARQSILLFLAVAGAGVPEGAEVGLLIVQG